MEVFLIVVTVYSLIEIIDIISFVLKWTFFEMTSIYTVFEDSYDEEKNELVFEVLVLVTVACLLGIIGIAVYFLEN